MTNKTNKQKKKCGKSTFLLQVLKHWYGIFNMIPSSVVFYLGQVIERDFARALASVCQKTSTRLKLIPGGLTNPHFLKAWEDLSKRLNIASTTGATTGTKNYYDVENDTTPEATSCEEDQEDQRTEDDDDIDSEDAEKRLEKHDLRCSKAIFNLSAEKKAAKKSSSAKRRRIENFDGRQRPTTTTTTTTKHLFGRKQQKTRLLAPPPQLKRKSVSKRDPSTGRRFLPSIVNIKNKNKIKQNPIETPGSRGRGGSRHSAIIINDNNEKNFGGKTTLTTAFDDNHLSSSGRKINPPDSYFANALFRGGGGGADGAGGKRGVAAFGGFAKTRSASKRERMKEGYSRPKNDDGSNEEEEGRGRAKVPPPPPPPPPTTKENKQNRSINHRTDTAGLHSPFTKTGINRHRKHDEGSSPLEKPQSSRASASSGRSFQTEPAWVGTEGDDGRRGIKGDAPASDGSFIHQNLPKEATSVEDPSSVEEESLQAFLQESKDLTELYIPRNAILIFDDCLTASAALSSSFGFQAPTTTDSHSSHQRRRQPPTTPPNHSSSSSAQTSADLLAQKILSSLLLRDSHHGGLSCILGE